MEKRNLPRHLGDLDDRHLVLRRCPFDSVQHRFDFTVADASLAPLVTVGGITFAGSGALTSAALYTSSAFTGDAFVDDFRVVRWTGAETTIAVGGEETN